MAPLAEHVHRVVLEGLDGIAAGESAGIYVVSLFVYDESDDPPMPTVSVGFDTEEDLALHTSDDASNEDGEARWNFAFWRQNELAVACQSGVDPEGARLREEWARENGLWYDLAEGECAIFNERGEPLTKAFVALLIDVVQRLHKDDHVCGIFGQAIPC